MAENKEKDHGGNLNGIANVQPKRYNKEKTNKVENLRTIIAKTKDGSGKKATIKIKIR